MPRDNIQLPATATRETYFRTMSALMRNVSTSAWITDTSLTFPFWPSSESAQFGPNLDSPYNSWRTEATTLNSTYECQNLTLESADMSNKRYFEVYSIQGYGPFNGTQPMVTFVLNSKDGCRYELGVHPQVDLAYNGGLTWSNTSTFFPTGGETLSLGNRIIPANVTSTHVYARVNASAECGGRDIILMNTPWTVPLNFTDLGPFKPANTTYEKSPTFRMRGLLCESSYSAFREEIQATPSESNRPPFSVDKKIGAGSAVDASLNLVNVSDFQAMGMGNDWTAYFDYASMQTDAKRAAESELGSLDAAQFPAFSGMGPILAALSGFNVTSMMDNPDIAQMAALIKGRVFMETIREAFNSPDLVQVESIGGEGEIVEERVVVLTEIGITLAVLFLVSFLLLLFIFWTSRLSRRPLNLQSDPASTVGLSLLLKPNLARASTLRSMHSATRSDFYTALQREKYLTMDDSLHKGSTEFAALCLLLILVVAAVLTLNAFSARSRLSQLAFIYEADISSLKLSFSTFAPISIAPTLVSIVVGLWWDQLDMTFRILQPYISMSRGPTPIRSGAGLTYRSKSWAGAAFKAARNRHWVLFMITTGSVLAQVLTVAMSALFEKRATNVVQQVELQQDLSLREIPVITEIYTEDSKQKYAPIRVLNELYLDASKNWLYGAGIQLSFNGSQLPWTFDGWNFLPMELSNMPGTDGTSTAQSKDGSTTSSTNVTVEVPAIRARLDCRPIDQLSNTSSWLDRVDPEDVAGILPTELGHLNMTGDLQLFYLPPNMFAGTQDHTTTLSSSNLITCCSNGTTDNRQKAVMGYWSPVMAPDWQPKDGGFPWEDMPWPLSIVPKWIVGRPFVALDERGDGELYFNEAPQIQAAHCQPIIETTKAEVTIDRDSGAVHSYSIKDSIIADTSAWEDVFTRHELDKSDTIYETNYTGPLNITTSYGILFLDSLLGSADRRHESSQGVVYYEDLNDNAFVIRDQKRGLNMDLMTYSMFNLAKKDPDALLDYTTLVEHADQTFQAFFQQFVNSGLSFQKGGYAYQRIDDRSTETLGRPVDINGTVLAERQFTAQSNNRTVVASLSNRIRVLHMNVVATYLSTAILIWLLGTAFIIVCLQRKYTGSMLRDVQLIADMLVLVAGSDNFLELVQDKGVALKRDGETKTMLGWFKDRDGEVRWGVEVVGGRNAVEWVDAPKAGWHVQSKTAGFLRWKKNTP
ncbi:hypothetical protein IQ07DRAFT_571304 [Pyrenochaeta sp. DS3sAY3a]|nr:hypothetical protein IQ07DRAFT_571304 [Pyrenochaeta sp. DS3sAY3a]